MKARIHRTRSAQAAKREARSALYPHGRGGMTGGTYHYVVIEPAVFSGTYAVTSTPTSDSHLPSLASAGLRWPPLASAQAQQHPDFSHTMSAEFHWHPLAAGQQRQALSGSHPLGRSDTREVNGPVTTLCGRWRWSAIGKCAQLCTSNLMLRLMPRDP